MDTIDLLQKARDFLAQPDRWCAYVRDDGQGRSCAMGGLAKAAFGQGATCLAGGRDEDCHPAVLALAAVLSPAFKARAPFGATAQVCLYNNTTDQKAVVAWFDRAIENLREHPMEKI